MIVLAEVVAGVVLPVDQLVVGAEIDALVGEGLGDLFADVVGVQDGGRNDGGVGEEDEED